MKDQVNIRPRPPRGRSVHSLGWIAVMLGCLACKVSAAELTVGPDKDDQRIEDALARAEPGDVLLVYPQPDNKPYEKVALYITQPRLTIKAVHGAAPRIPLSGQGFDFSGQGRIPRAIVQFNKGADACVLEGFELFGAHNESHNGAGVRINQANDILIRNCAIHNNDMGIMSNGDGTPNTAVNQRIEDSLIYRNGDLADPGYNHNLYLGGTSVTLQGCEVHSSLTGHNIKSRAHRTVVTACYVHDSANREFDLVDGKGDTTVAGSDAILVGNIIVKARHCAGNRAVIHFGKDGGQEHDGTLYLVHNTIVSPFISPIVHLSATQARVQLYNNIVWDGGGTQKGQVLVEARKEIVKAEAVSGSCNWVSAGFLGAALDALPLQQTASSIPSSVLSFVAPESGNYRLLASDAKIVGKGCALPDAVLEVISGEFLQYKPPQGTELRPVDGKPDLGAYEFAPKR